MAGSPSCRSLLGHEACLGMKSSGLTSRCQFSRQHDRAAFTLLEVLAVMSLLVVASALLLPSLQRWQRDISLQQAVALTRAGLLHTRLAAIDAARSHGFVYEVDGRRFGVTDEPSTNALRQWLGELPVDTRFVAEGATSRHGFMTPIWFRPDGTATDAVLWIQDARGQRQRLAVRRLTGGVSSEAAAVN